MLQLLCIIIYQLSLMTLFFHIYIRIRGTNATNGVFSKQNYNFYVSNMVFISISLIVFLPVSIILVYVLRELKDMINPLFIETGILLYIVLIFANIIIQLLYYAALMVINSCNIPIKLQYLGVNARMLAYIAICFLMMSINFLDISKDLSFLAITVIMGRFLWIDNNIQNMKESIIYFFSLQYWNCLLYINLLGFFIFCLFYRVFYVFSLSIFCRYLILLIVTTSTHAIILFFMCEKKEILRELEKIFTEYMEEILKTLKDVNKIWGNDIACLIQKKSILNWPKNDIYVQFVLIAIMRRYKFRIEMHLINNNLAVITVNNSNIVIESKSKKQIRLIIGEKILSYSINYYNKLENSLFEKKEYLPYIFIALSINDSKKIGKLIKFSKYTKDI